MWVQLSDMLEEGTVSSPYERLKQINKAQFQEYLQDKEQRDKSKANAVALFARYTNMC